MADWIKMRSSLLTNPKVVRMARVLLADREFLEWLCPGCDVSVTRDESVTKRHVPVVTRVVAGALLATWSAVNDTAARDGVVRYASSRDIDETAGVPGFGAALKAVDWLRELPEGEGVQFVNFEEHNSPHKERSLTAKTSAERQADYRARKKSAGDALCDGDVGRDVTRDITSDVTSNRREEKRREEKNKKRANALSSANMPTWMTQLVDAYHEVLPELPGVVVMDAKRQKAMREFREWVLSTSRKDGTPRAENDADVIAWAREYFSRARSNDWLMGRTDRPAEHRNWKPSIQWMLSSAGMQAVLERTEVPE